MADERCPALLHVDSFTRVAFAGNPAAVCLLDAPADATWMGAVAANQNLSETAFMWPTGASEVEGLEGEPARGETFELRWFTPSVEVDLCGHATLAAAHALFSAPGGRESPLLRFGTRSGELVAALRGEGCIELEFPASPPRPLLDGVGPTRGEVALALGLPVDKVVVVGASDDLLVAEIARDRSRLHGIARDQERSAEIARDCSRPSEIARDHPRSREIARDRRRLRCPTRAPSPPSRLTCTPSRAGRTGDSSSPPPAPAQRPTLSRASSGPLSGSRRTR